MASLPPAHAVAARMDDLRRLIARPRALQSPLAALMPAAWHSTAADRAVTAAALRTLLAENQTALDWLAMAALQGDLAELRL